MHPVELLPAQPGRFLRKCPQYGQRSYGKLFCSSARTGYDKFLLFLYLTSFLLRAIAIGIPRILTDLKKSGFKMGTAFRG